MEQTSGYNNMASLFDIIVFLVFILLFFLCNTKAKSVEKKRPWEILFLAILFVFLNQKEIVIGKLTINIKIPLWTTLLFFLIFYRNKLMVYYINLNKLIPNIFLGITLSMVIFVVFYLFLHCNKNYSTPYELFPHLNFAILIWIFFNAIKEEVLFRGIVQGCLLEFGFSKSLSILIQATMFSVVHIYYIFSGNSYNIIYIFLFGLLFGIITEKRKNLMPAILIHFSLNLLIFGYNISIYSPFSY